MSLSRYNRMHTMKRLLHRFLTDERASVTVEVVLMMPILLWGYFGLFILFEGYRNLSANIRAAYTISDMLSRETNAINAAYIEGLNDIQDVITQSPHRTVLRVSVVRYDDDDDQHDLVWSYSTAGKTAVSQAGVDTLLKPYLPSMSDGEVQVVVETWMAFVPFLNIDMRALYAPYADWSLTGFHAFYFESLVTTRPRFAGQLCWEGATSC